VKFDIKSRMDLDGSGRTEELNERERLACDRGI
jgi:hypothetical protein